MFRFVKSDKSRLVWQRFQQIVGLLQDFRRRVRSDWICQLDSDCGLILDQPLIQQKQDGTLEVNCSHKVSQRSTWCQDQCLNKQHVTRSAVRGNKLIRKKTLRLRFDIIQK